MKVTIDVPEQTLKDLLCTAVEGGSNYWARFSSINMKDGDYEAVVVTEHESSTDGPARVQTVTWVDMCHGLEALTQPDLKHFQEGVALKHFTDALTDHDATTADVVLQMTVFGEVVYG